MKIRFMFFLLLLVVMPLVAQEKEDTNSKIAVENVEFENDNKGGIQSQDVEQYPYIERVPSIITYPIAFALLFALYFIFLNTAFIKLLNKGTNPVLAAAKSFSSWLSISYCIMLITISDFFNWDFGHILYFLKMKMILIISITIIYILTLILTKQLKAKN